MRSTEKKAVRFGLSVLLLALLLAGCAGEPKRAGIDLPLAPEGDRLVRLDNGICQDVRTGLMWQMDTSRTLGSLDQARSYAASLTLGGHRDWRLPTVAELYELYSIFDLHQNGECDLKVEGIYWSDEPDQEGRVGTWELDDNCDPERQYIPKKRGRVRAVRP